MRVDTAPRDWHGNGRPRGEDWRYQLQPTTKKDLQLVNGEFKMIHGDGDPVYDLATHTLHDGSIVTLSAYMPAGVFDGVVGETPQEDGQRFVIREKGGVELSYAHYCLGEWGKTPKELWLKYIATNENYINRGYAKEMLRIIARFEPQAGFVSGYAMNQASGKLLKHPSWKTLPPLEESGMDSGAHYPPNASHPFYFRTPIASILSRELCVQLPSAVPDID